MMLLISCDPKQADFMMNNAVNYVMIYNTHTFLQLLTGSSRGVPDGTLADQDAQA